MNIETIISKNIESGLEREVQHKIKDGSGKKISINTHYLGATRQVPTLLKGIYTIMPNVEIFLDTDSDLGYDIKAYSVIDELKSSTFYLEQNKLQKVHSLENNNVNIDLNITFSVDPPYYIREKISYKKGYDNDLDIWIDPLKFEPRKLLNKEEQDALRKKYGINKNDYVIIGGSIHRDELQTFIDAVTSIKHSKSFSPKRVLPIIVPRTNADCRRMQSLIEESVVINEEKGNDDIIFVEEKGVLADLYSIADIAFIGFTLFQDGQGQNPLEPAFYGKRLVAGKYRNNNLDAFEGLESSGLLTCVSATNLKKEFARIVPEKKMEIYRKNAAEFIKSEQGAAIKYAKVMQNMLYK